MSSQEPPVDDAFAAPTGARESATPAVEVLEDDGDWLPEDEQMPRRPRRRLLAPRPVALLLVLMTACGFIGGVLVEKGQLPSGGSTGASAGLPSSFAALRSGRFGAGANAAPGVGGASVSGSPAGAGSGAATAGLVSFIHGATLYVTTAEGNTVKVTSSPASTVTKTVKSTVKGIHPGETVIVTGPQNANGAVSAETIRVSSGAATGALSSLFGRSGEGAGAASARALFGSGG
jgi:hypothetical protein